MWSPRSQCGVCKGPSRFELFTSWGQTISFKADRLSHHPSTCQDNLDRSLEWSLEQGVANLLFRVFGSPWVDMFATGANAMAPLFYTRTWRDNALHVDWSKAILYMYPRIPLLHPGSSQSQVRRGIRDCHAFLVSKKRLAPSGSESLGQPSSASTSLPRSDQKSLGTS